MAFMMPVVKKDWNIYKSNRSRKTSECNTSCTSRTRKISECASEGNGTVSNNRLEVPIPKHHSVPDRMPSRAFTRPRTSSEHLPNRAKASIPPENNKQVSVSANDLKQGSNGWLDKLRKFVKNKKREEERSK